MNDQDLVTIPRAELEELQARARLVDELPEVDEVAEGFARWRRKVRAIEEHEAPFSRGER